MSNCGAGGNTYTVTVDQNNNHRFRFSAHGHDVVGNPVGPDDGHVQHAAPVPGRVVHRRHGNLTVNAATSPPARRPRTSTSSGTRRSGPPAAKFTEDGVHATTSSTPAGTTTGRPSAFGPTASPAPSRPTLGTTGVGGDGSRARTGTVGRPRGWGPRPAVRPRPRQVVRFIFASVPRSGNFLGNGNADGEWRARGQAAAPAAGSSPWSRSRLARRTHSSTSSVPFLDNEIAIDPTTRWPESYPEDAVGAVTAQPAVGGMRAAGNTPIAESLPTSTWCGKVPAAPEVPLWTRSAASAA